MSIEFEVVIDTQQYSVDMKSGLDTLKGVSDGMRCIAQTVLERKVPARKTAKAPIRTIMKRTFEGSYGLSFSIDIFDEILQRKFISIGHSVFSEIISYFLNESIYLEQVNLSQEAKEIIESLGYLSEELIERLRITALNNIHAVTKNFGCDVKVQHRQHGETKILVEFNEASASTLDVERSNQEVEILATVTRLNTKTGNGRLQLKGEMGTVAFGFATEYQSISMIGKKKFSKNLDDNNGLQPEHQEYFKIKASPIRTHSEKIIKYIIEGYGD